MAVPGISSIGISHVAGGAQPKAPAQKFSAALKAEQQNPQTRPPQLAGALKPKAAVPAPTAGRTLDQLSAAQSRMDEVLKLAQSGKSFTPAELLSLQTQVYRASQELDLAGKVVEKATGGVKQVLQTQV
jgi:hypothetical protein